MLDRLFMPALTFTLLVAAAAAFVTEFDAAPRQQRIVKLERVIVTAQRELPATPLAQAEGSSTAVLR